MRCMGLILIFGRGRQGVDVDPFFAQRGDFIARSLAIDASRLDFLIVDLARLFREAFTHIVGIGRNMFTQIARKSI